MAVIPKYLRRSTAILRMPQALARGMTASGFLRKLQGMGIGYQKQRFLADWRSVAGIEKRKDAFKFVRRDRRPPMSAIADVEWELEKEYMYKVRAWTRVAPGEALEERFINIGSDKPLSPDEIESAAKDIWSDEQDSTPGELDRVQAVAGFHRIEGSYMED